MATAKVTVNGTTIVDLTDATRTADKILQGFTAYIADGSKAVGTASGGGSGLTYETGTYTPTSDIARPTISFGNTHTTEPILVVMSDTGTFYNTTNSNHLWFVVNFQQLGGPIYQSSSSPNYAIAFYRYRGTNSSNFSASNTTITSTTGTTTNSLGYWVTASEFYPSSTSTSRYWRRGRTYKWIAVWGPTT